MMPAIQRNRSAVLLRKGPVRRGRVSRVDDVELQFPGPGFDLGDEPQAVCAVGASQRVRRLSVLGKGGPGSQSIQGKVATIAVVWTNYGSAAATEKWTPDYELVDFSGAVVKTLPATVNLKTLVHDDSSQPSEEAVPVSSTESVHVDLTGGRRGATRCGHRCPGNSTSRAPHTW